MMNYPEFQLNIHTFNFVAVQGLEDPSLSSSSGSEQLQDRSQLYNLVVMGLVREGELDKAVTLLERIALSDGEIQAFGSTVS